MIMKLPGFRRISRCSLVWYVTQRRLVVGYRRFGNYRSHFQVSSSLDPGNGNVMFRNVGTQLPTCAA